MNRRPSNAMTLCAASPSFSTVAFAQTCPPWEVVPVPNAAGAVQSVIRDLDALAQSDVWAVGSHHNNSQITQLAMHWDGAAWTFYDVPVPISWGSGFLWAVAARGPDDVWAAGDALRTAPDGFTGTHMLVVHWDGTRWNRLQTPINTGGSGDFIWDIKIVGPDEVWFVGEGFPGSAWPQPPLAMRWRSGSFELLNPPVLNLTVSAFGNGNSFHAVDALSPTDVWVVGAGGDGDPIANVSQILHWDGDNWEHRPGPIPGIWHDLDAVVALAANDVWAGGEYFDGTNYRGLSMHWDGSAWTEFPVPGSIVDFIAFAPDDIFACGGHIMHWNGAAWTVVETFPTVDSPSLAGFDALDSCEMWAGGRQFIGESILNFAARVVPGGACALDFNADGIYPDNLDLFDFLNVFGGGTCSNDPHCDDIDVNADGVYPDIADLEEFLLVFGRGC